MRFEIRYKVITSIVFGLLGFAVNFWPVDFVFYGSYKMSLLFGLVFPMLITLAWGWKYGLLSALCGGCQTMWILWMPKSGYGPFVSVPPFTLWIVWLGWFARTRYNIYLGEIIFRIFNTVLLYTVFRWAFILNTPPANVVMPLTVVHSIAFKELINGLLILLTARGLLHSDRVRRFFKLPKSTVDPRAYYICTNAVVLGSMLMLLIAGETHLWNTWTPVFQGAARILGSLLLLMIGILCTYGAADVFAKRKTEELIQADKALKASEGKLLQIIDGNSIPTFVIDGQHTITHWNKACENLTGVSATDRVGTKKQWSSFCSAERPVMADLIVDGLAEEEIAKYYGGKHKKSVHVEGAYEAEGFFPSFGEAGKWFFFGSAPLRDGKGNVIGAIETIQDVSERKRAEGALQKAHDELEIRVRERTADLQAMNKELEAFAYSVSHDLRAPLRAIDGFSQILLEDYLDALDEQGRHYLQRVRAGTQNMGQLIDDLLNLSRIGRQPMTKKTINLEAIAGDAYKSMEDKWKDRKVNSTLHQCSPVLADPNLMQIVFVNLFSNALKFTVCRETAEIEVGSDTKDDQTVFFVKDNGVGLDMKYADKVFVPFQRLHRVEEYQGTGVGLSIVQRIIHRHGGRIWVESEVDVGTTFYFTV